MVQDLKLDTKHIPTLIQQKFDLIKSLKQLHPENKYTYGQPTFCPFHDNHDTPAAAVYKSVDHRPDSLFCFAEQRQYTVVDVIGKLMGHNIYEVGHAIWNQMSVAEKQVFLQTVTNNDSMMQAFATTNKIDEMKQKLLNNFKHMDITLNELFKQMV